MIAMKKLSPYLLYLFIGILLATLFGSCDTEHDNAVTLSKSENTIDHIQSILSAGQPVIQNYTVNSNVYNTITGNKGTRITIPGNAFVDQNGNPVSGNISFELQEVFSAGDMIATGKMTSSGGQLLASGGEMYINATQGSSQLKLAPGKSLEFKVPTNSYDSQMGLFTGNGGDADNFDWVPNSTPVSQCVDSSIVILGNYCFNLDTLINWINCDYFYSDPRPLTEVEIQVPQGYDDQNTLVYVYVPSINSVAKANNYQNGSFYINGGYRLPVGLAVTFVGVHYDGVDFYYSIQNAVIVNNHVEVLSFQQVTAAQLAQLLASL